MHDETFLEPPWILRSHFFYIILQIVYTRDGEGNGLTKTGQEPNGMKLASERLLDQLLAQLLSGFNHQREALGSPLLDPRLHSMRSDRVDDQAY